MVILNRNYQNYGIEITPPIVQDEKELITVDLTVGDIYNIPGSSTNYRLENTIELESNQCIIIKTKEHFQLQDNVFGLICSKGGLTAKGLMVGNTKMDPKFHGHLRVAIFNISDRKQKIEQNSKFCSLFFIKLEQDTGVDSSRESPYISDDRRSMIKVFLDKHLIQLIIGLITIIGSGLTAYLSILAAK